MKVVKNNKTHLVFSRELLESIDEFVGKRKRSRFVLEATKEKLAKERFLKILERTAGAWKDKNHPKLRARKDVDKYIRKLRSSFSKRTKRIYG